jgi:polyphosphate glucokinase
VKWNRRILEMIAVVHSLLHYDLLYLVGGNFANFVVDPPDNIHPASNDAGTNFDIHLWDAGFGMSAEI